MRTIFVIAFLFYSSNLAGAQVIQLPSNREFSVTGGALVPDGGTAMLGGVGYHASGSASRGGRFGPGHYAGGSVVGGSSAWVSAQVIDLEAMDLAILSANVPPPATPNQNASLPSGATGQAEADQARKFISNYRGPSQNVERSTYSDFQRAFATPPKHDPPVPAAVAESNIRYYLKLALEAENAGRIQSSRVYYRMAMEAMTPELIDRYNRLVAERQRLAEMQKQNAAANRKPF